MKSSLAHRAAGRAVVVILASLGSNPMATAASFTGLGFLPGGGNGPDGFSYASDVSPNGIVVGQSTNAAGHEEAFRWSAAGGMQGLGILGANPAGMSRSFANGISDDGSVITGGTSSTTVTSTSTYGGTVAFRWTQSSGMEDLGLFPGGGGGRSTGSDISADGSTIVGASMNTAGIWKDRAWQDIGDLPGGSESGFAWAVSADGSVVVGDGLSGTGAGTPEAFRWTAAGGMTGLGIPAGAARSNALGVSSDGQVVVGDFGISNLSKQAAYWTESTGWVGMGTMGYARANANGITDDYSIIVGNASTYDPLTGSSSAAGFIWDSDHGMRDIAEIFAADYGLSLSGWLITNVSAISGDGRFIVGAGTNPEGLQEAWIADLHPVPVPAAVWLFGSALAGLALRGRRQAAAFS